MHHRAMGVVSVRSDPAKTEQCWGLVHFLGNVPYAPGIAERINELVGKSSDKRVMLNCGPCQRV